MPPPPRLSLTSRLVAAAVLWVIAGCALGAVALDHAFREAQAHRLAGKLDLAARVIAGGLTVDESGAPVLAGAGLRETENGTWYWQVTLPDGRSLRSATLGDAELASGLAQPGEITIGGYDAGPRGDAVVTAETVVLLPGDVPAHVKVALADREMRDALARFRSILATIMVLLSAGLAAAIVMQVRWGLAPVRRVLADLRRVGEGEGPPRLDEDVPRELSPLVAAFNDTLDANRRTVERSRNLAGNLAHALKTEIAVLRSEVARHEPEARRPLERRLATMTDLVERHLGRGGLAGVTGSGSARTDSAAVLGEICTMLDKVYGPQGRDIALKAAQAPDFRGDRDDFVEMVGNLVENACKHARRHVRVLARGQGDRLVVRVEDDGPGLPAERRAEALKRGTRLDEQVPGSGLGLAIVADLVEDYGGTVTLGDSAGLGGLLVELVLPTSATVQRSPVADVA